MTAALCTLLSAPHPVNLAAVAHAFTRASASIGSVIFLSDGSELRVGAAEPADPENAASLRVAVGQSAAGQVAQHGHAIRLSADAPRTPAYRAILGLGEGSAVARICLPARGDGGAIVAVVTMHRPTDSPYSDDDMTTLQPYADLLGIRLQLQDLRNAVDEHHTERERLIAAAVSAQEGERRRIAYDLHDGVTTALASMSFHLNAAELSIADVEWSTGESELTPAIVNALEQSRSQIAVARSLADLAYGQTRAAITGLHNLVLSDLGLVAAVESLAETSPGVPIDVACDNPETFDALSDHAAAALFRIAQETAANSARHARASRITITLRRSNGAVVLETTDDGVGFDVRAVREAPSSAEDASHFGLASIAERCALIGASLRIDSAPGAGTTVTVELPLH
ncbi:MAG TPA: GAF domain-containing sensor histidine kinase [Actinomycetaceae bacterium]|nr:GAF domain-containing sensor histidine kinase [Actinomycetaceae bacterium]